MSGRAAKARRRAKKVTAAPANDHRLLPQHVALIAASGINDEVAAARGYRSVTKKSELRALGFGPSQARVPGLLVPVHNVLGEVVLYQIRPDSPRMKDGNVIKYETPLGSRMVLDVPPGARARLGDPAAPLIVTEGVRKADSAVSRGLCCVALLGVWNWRGTNEDGGKVALADWESVALNGRQAYIVFDSDVALKPEVHGALSRLKAFLESRGATVAIIYLPAGDGGAKVGLDDYLAASHTVDEMLALAAPVLRDSPIEHDDGPAITTNGGGAIVLEDPEPSDEPVVGSGVLDEVVAVLERHVVLPAHAAAAIALWVAHTHLFDAFDISPVLAIGSPTKRCGKTTLLRLLAGLVRRALPASGISAAAVFRTVEAHGPTLLVDEMDAMKENEELRGVLNSGHTRDLAYVIRVVGEGGNMEPRRFSTWAPKALAHIGRLSGTLEDRAVRVAMRRALPGERRMKVRRRQLNELLAPIRARLARWAQDTRELLKEPTVPDVLDDRAADNWEPLLSIADAAGDHWPGDARRAAVSLSSERGDDEADENPGLLVLADLRAMLDAGGLDGCDGLSGEAACEELRRLTDRPWKAWGRGKDGLQPVHLARLLRPFGVQSDRRTRSARRYPLDALTEAFTRYLAGSDASVKPVSPVTGPDPSRASRGESAPRDGVTGVTGPERCDGSETNVDVYRHSGVDYRSGDVLPDGRVVTFEDGIPILLRPRPEARP